MKFKNHSGFDKRIRFNRKLLYIYSILIIAVATIGIGYASLYTSLNINGAAAIKKSNWGVHLETINVTSGSVTPTVEPTISNDNTVYFEAGLENPGDFYEFTVNLVNDGTMNATLNSINISPELTNTELKYLQYDVNYSDGSSINPNDTLNVGEIKTVKITLKYKDDATIDIEEYPKNDKNYNIQITFDYMQS